jgi:hypothetical protein
MSKSIGKSVEEWHDEINDILAGKKVFDKQGNPIPKPPLRSKAASAKLSGMRNPVKNEPAPVPSRAYGALMVVKKFFASSLAVHGSLSTALKIIGKTSLMATER